MSREIVRSATARRVAAVAGGLLVSAVALRLLYGRGLVGYDTSAALLWGSDLVHGRHPNFEVGFAPTPHPLSYALLAPVSLLGDPAYDVVEAMSWLSFAFLGYAAIRLGTVLFAWPIGVAFAVVLLTRPLLLDETLQAFVDIPCLALVLLAAAWEAERPRRGIGVLVLLALAGLLRPESWLLAGVYALYVMRGSERREQVAYAALAAAGPGIWALCDLLVTGDPLHSLHSTQTAAERIGRAQGLGNAIELIPTYLVDMMRAPIVWCGFAGSLLVLYLLFERALLPGAILVLGLGGFLVLGVADLPLLRRYMFPAGAVLGLFCIVAAVGWLLLDRDDARRRPWALASVVAVAVVVLSIPSTIDAIGDVRDKGDALSRAQLSLRDLLSRDSVRDTLRGCGAITVPDLQLGSQVAFEAQVPLGTLRLASHPAGRGSFVGPVSGGMRAFYVRERGFFVYRDSMLPGYRRAAANEDWALWVRC